MHHRSQPSASTSLLLSGLVNTAAAAVAAEAAEALPRSSARCMSAMVEEGVPTGHSSGISGSGSSEHRLRTLMNVCRCGNTGSYVRIAATSPTPNRLPVDADMLEMPIISANSVACNAHPSIAVGEGVQDYARLRYRKSDGCGQFSSVTTKLHWTPSRCVYRYIHITQEAFHMVCVCVAGDGVSKARHDVSEQRSVRDCSRLARTRR
jgi:hypothetical protein